LLAGATRIDIDLSGTGGLTIGPERRRRRDDVADSIAVDVANATGDPAELIAPGLSHPFVDDPHGLHERPDKILWPEHHRFETRIQPELLEAAAGARQVHVERAALLEDAKRVQGVIDLSSTGLDSGDGKHGLQSRRSGLLHAPERRDRFVQVALLPVRVA
jgi:hypothetical protein